MCELDQRVECVWVDQRQVLILLQVPADTNLMTERVPKKQSDSQDLKLSQKIEPSKRNNAEIVAAQVSVSSGDVGKRGASHARSLQLCDIALDTCWYAAQVLA